MADLMGHGPPVDYVWAAQAASAHLRSKHVKGEPYRRFHTTGNVGHMALQPPASPESLEGS